MSSIRSIFPAPSADGEARPDSSGPSVEDGPAPGSPRAGAGLPTFTRDELMDAARACEYRAEAFTTAGTWSDYWMQLGRRFEEAAIAASQ